MRYIVLFVIVLSSMWFASANWHEEAVSQTDVLINVWVQLLNLIIFFFIFKKFFAWPIVEAVEKRKQMLEQFKNADEILEKKKQEAEQEKKKLIEEWKDHKAKLLMEAKQEADQMKQQILEQAEREKQAILEKAEQKIQSEKEELEKSWSDSVKKGVYAVYEKLVNDKNPELIDKYVENIKIK